MKYYHTLCASYVTTGCMLSECYINFMSQWLEMIAGVGHGSNDIHKHVQHLVLAT